MEPNRAGPLIFVHEPYFLNGKHPKKKINNDWIELPKIRAIKVCIAVLIPKTRAKPIPGKSRNLWQEMFHQNQWIEWRLGRSASEKKTKIEFGDSPKIRAINDLLIVKNLLTDRKKSIRALRNPWQEMFHRSARFESQNA